MTLVDIMQDDKKCIDQFRLRMEGQMHQSMYEDDGLFRRFLIARNYDLDAAEEMLKNNLTWRKENKIDKILTDFHPPEVAKRYITLDFLGYDKEGSPVFFVNIGYMDMRGLLKSLKKMDIINYFVQYIENSIELMKKQSEKLNKTVDNFIWILNLDNFSFATATHKLTILTLSKLISIYELNYPERLNVAYLINSSYYGLIAWQMVKTFIAGRTVQKAKVFGKEGWKEELLKIIDADVLPAFLGGTRTDPDGDPMCKSFLHLGGTVPESCFIVKKKSLSQKLESKTMIVNRFSKAQVKLEVLIPGSTIEYEFETKSRDIAFSVIHQEIDHSEVNVIVPKQRIDTNMDSEAGMFRCDREGIYILEFDNSYSWFHPKEVYYTADVIGPQKENGKLQSQVQESL